MHRARDFDFNHDALRKWHEFHEYSYEAAGNIIDASARAVRSWVKGLNKPSLYNAHKIAKAMGVPPETMIKPR